MQSALKEWRESREWTLAEIAGLTGLSTTYLSLIERGIREPPPATKVLIARRLGAAVGDLFPVSPVPVP